MSGAHNHYRDARNRTEHLVRFDRPVAPNVDDYEGRSILSQETGHVLELARASDLETAAHKQRAQLRFGRVGDVEQ